MGSPGELSPAEIRDIADRAAGPDPVAAWTFFLPEMTRAIAAAFPGTLLTAPNRRVPFAGLYAPIVVLARQKIRANHPHLDAWMRDAAAWHGLESHLLNRISEICSLALQPRFLAFKTVAGMFGRTSDPNLYRAFVNEQGMDGLRAFFRALPVAARLTAQVSLFWMDAVTEFFTRLDADADAIAAHFFTRRPPGKIVSAHAGMSDPHHGGRTVWIVAFENGERLVYKPRSLEIDAAFYDVLRRLNRARPRRPPLPTPAVLCRQGYGWQTFVERSSCRTRREAKRWFQQAGAMLCMLHAARGIDVHCENLIATAAGPVIVDLEGLFHPPVPAADADPESGWSLDATILRTGMLPVRSGGSGVSRSALDAPVCQRSARDEVRWKHVNSDRMEAVLAPARHAYPAHRARLRGRLLSVRRYSDELVAGFRSTARLLLDDRGVAREWATCAARMARLPARHIRRPTALYLSLIRGSLYPRLLASELARRDAWQSLPILKNDDDASHCAEIAALDTLDVPYSYRAGPTGAADITIPNREDFALQAFLIRESVRGRLSFDRGWVRRLRDCRAGGPPAEKLVLSPAIERRETRDAKTKRITPFSAGGPPAL